eukprot:2831819-Pleurochrysis_carterae.AAC.1
MLHGRAGVLRLFLHAACHTVGFKARSHKVVARTSERVRSTLGVVLLTRFASSKDAHAAARESAKVWPRAQPPPICTSVIRRVDIPISTTIAVFLGCLPQSQTRVSVRKVCIGGSTNIVQRKARGLTCTNTRRRDRCHDSGRAPQRQLAEPSYFATLHFALSKIQALTRVRVESLCGSLGHDEDGGAAAVVCKGSPPGLVWRLAPSPTGLWYVWIHQHLSFTRTTRPLRGVRSSRFRVAVRCAHAEPSAWPFP